MAAVTKKMRRRGEELARNLARFRGVANGADFEHRLSALEEEIQECRQLNLRLAELTDVVQELLLPVAQRDEARVAELAEKYSKGV